PFPRGGVVMRAPSRRLIGLALLGALLAAVPAPAQRPAPVRPEPFRPPPVRPEPFKPEPFKPQPYKPRPSRHDPDHPEDLGGYRSPTEEYLAGQRAQRLRDAETTRLTLERSVNTSPVEALQTLQREGGLLDAHEQSRYAREAIDALGKRANETNEPWE